jgi:glycosyltransferase involved in cell wall biosynthesis
MIPKNKASIAFSIIINNYNYGRFLREAIDSALDQTYPGVEVIVVDDGSTDESRDVIASYGTRLVSVLKANGGQASAFNAGFAASQGDWILFLDSDDVFATNKAESLMAYTRRFSSVGFMAHNLEYCDESGGPTSWFDSPIASLQVVDDRRMVRRGKVSALLPATSALAVERRVLSEILPMPEDIVITADNYIKTAARSLTPMLLIPEQLAKQRIHHRNSYTRFAQTDETRLKQWRIGAEIGFRLKERFPYLSKLAWKQYGHVLFELGASKSPNAKSILKHVQSNYNSFDYSPVCCYYVAGAYVKSLLRDRMGTILSNRTSLRREPW